MAGAAALLTQPQPSRHQRQPPVPRTRAQAAAAPPRLREPSQSLRDPTTNTTGRAASQHHHEPRLRSSRWPHDDLIEKTEKQPNLTIGVIVSVIIVILTVLFKILFGGKKPAKPTSVKPAAETSNSQGEASGEKKEEQDEKEDTAAAAAPPRRRTRRD